MAEAHPFRGCTIGEIATLLRRREVSVLEVAEASMRLLEHAGRPLNAVASLIPERTRQEAAAAQARLDRDEAAAHVLTGVPYGAKDLIAVTGAPTTWGSAYFTRQVFTEDAAVIRRLGSLGGVLAAKLCTSELAGAGRAARPGMSVHGQGINPWNPKRIAGGSSSGSAIAVSIGAVPYALGTETAGSVVGPAAYSGVTGLRPTHGSISRNGVMMLSPTLDKVGVLARTAEDCGHVFGALRRDAPLTVADDRDRHRRIGFLPVELDECIPAARSSFASAVAEFADTGAELEEAGLSRTEPFASALETIMLSEANWRFRDHLADPRFTLIDEAQNAEFRSGQAFTAVEYLQAREVRRAALNQWARVFSEVDMVLSISRPTTAPRLDQRRQRDPSMSDAVRAAANLAGIPGISFPCGFAEDGLPVGLHLVGPAHSEAMLVEVASRYQRATRHHLALPPIGSPS